MKPTQALRGGHVDPVNGHYIGNWGHFGGEKQRGIVTYGLSANRQRPFAGASHDFFFNTFRRTKAQIFFWLPPAIGGYYMMQWAVEHNHFLQSKQGRALNGDEEE